MELESVLKFAQAFGAPVAICLVMLYAFARWIVRQDDKGERREEAHRIERKEDREAHIGALKEITGQFNVHTQTLQTASQKLEDLAREVRENNRRAG